MPVYKIVLSLGKSGMGSSEAYLTPTVTESAANGVVNNLIASRNAMVHTRTEWQGLRLSEVGARRRSVFYPPGFYKPFGGTGTITVPKFGAFLAPSGDHDADQWRSCLQVRVAYDNLRRTVRYIVSIPDSIIIGEPGSFNPGGSPKWVQAFQDFSELLVNRGFQIYARDNSGAFPVRPILNWVKNTVAPFDLGVQVSGAPAVGIVAGDMITVQGVRRKGTDKISYNGKYLVVSVDVQPLPAPTTLYLRGTSTGDPATVKLPGTVQKVAYKPQAIEGFTAIRGGIHKRGKYATAPAGRRRTRQSLGI